MQIRVYYEDTDVGGFLYHSNYLNYCERARSEIFFQNGLTPISNDFHFVVKSLRANYLKSAKFGDLVNIETKLLKHRLASISLLQEIYRDSELIFQMEIELVYLKKERVSKIPKELIELFLHSCS